MIIDIVLGKAIGRGGLELVITLVSSELQKRGHRVRVFQMCPPDHLEWLDTLTEIYYYDTSEINRIEDGENPDLVRYVIGYKKLISNLGNPDLVLATHTPLFSLMCRAALEHLGRNCPPIISWLHGPPEAYGDNGEILNQSDAHLAISETIGEKIYNIVKDKKSVFYVGNPIPDYTSTIIYRNLEHTTFTFIGRLDNLQKRLDILFNALSRLKGEWTLKIIGEGSDAQTLRNLAVSLNINSKIRWLGWQENPWDMVEGTSLIVLSSDYEGLPMVLIESLSRGIPVVSTEIDGATEVVDHGINGWLYPREDSEALRKILQKVVDNAIQLPSPKVCVDSVQRYDISNVVDRMEIAFNYAFDITKKKQKLKIWKSKFENWNSLNTVVQEKYLNEIETEFEFWLDNGNDVEATNLIYELENNNIDSEFVNVLKGHLLLKQGEHEQVIKFFTEFERTLPRKREGLLLGKAYEKAGSTIKALKKYTQYINEKDVQYLPRVFDLLKKQKKPQISLLTYTNSGCNATALKRLIPADIEEKYNVRLFWEDSYDNLDDFVKESELVVTTQANYPFNYKQFNIDLWHGFPLKAMMNMDHGEQRSSQLLHDFFEKVDYISSYSGMFNTLFNACIGTRITKYQITGAPRNDLLNKNNKEWFINFLNKDLKEEKLILYTPTFRAPFFNPTKIEGHRTWDNLFGFDEFNQKMFEDYLEENNIYLIVKLHPVEESRIQEEVSIHDSSRIKLLTQLDIAQYSMDFYELLSSFDVLLTDYSSIFFDYLLLDRPVIFTPTDIETYKGKRGFLLEPYEHWTPGPKVNEQQSLMSAISRSITDESYFKEERKRVREIVHYYQDFSSVDRVWGFIDNLLDLQTVNDVVKDIEDKISSRENLINSFNNFIDDHQYSQVLILAAENENIIQVDSELNTIVATAYFNLNELDKCILALLQAYQLNPASFDAIYSLAIIYEIKGEVVEAKSYYELALQLCDESNIEKEIIAKLSFL